MTHDRLVLTLLGHDFRWGLRALSWSDVAWIGLGGGLLAAYAIADVWVGLVASAPHISGDQGLWLVRAPLTIVLIAGVLGGLSAGAAGRRATAPFLRALPIEVAARKRMALVAALALGVPAVLLTLVAVTSAALIVGKPGPLIWGFGEAAVAAAAFALAALSRLRTLPGRDDVGLAAPRPRAGWLLPGVGAIDRSPLPWLGSWAWNLPGGRLLLTVRGVFAAAALTLGAVLSIGASFGRHEATPAATAGFIGGLAVFMLTVRFAPLESAVLRTAPVDFGRAWRRLLRLPLLLSAAFFTVPAGAATIVEPSTAAGRVQDGLGLAVLDASYAVFAAYFATSPLAGALSFFAALVYSVYEASEFGGAMVIALAGLLVLLWVRMRARFLHG